MVNDFYFLVLIIDVSPLYKRSLYALELALALVRGTAFRAGADIPFEIHLYLFLSFLIDCPSASPWCCSFTLSMLLENIIYVVTSRSGLGQRNSGFMT